MCAHQPYRMHAHMWHPSAFRSIQPTSACPDCRQNAEPTEPTPRPPMRQHGKVLACPWRMPCCLHLARRAKQQVQQRAVPCLQDQHVGEAWVPALPVLEPALGGIIHLRRDPQSSTCQLSGSARLALSTQFAHKPGNEYMREQSCSYEKPGYTRGGLPSACCHIGRYIGP